MRTTDTRAPFVSSESAFPGNLIRGHGELARRFAECGIVARIDDGVGIDNQEQGEPIGAFSAPLEPWSREWRPLRHLG